jgi:hypothetical protein
VHAACNGFRQWERSHDAATLSRATNNLDQWALGDNLGTGRDMGGGASYMTELDRDMDFLNTVAQSYPNSELPAATRNVVNDCKGL